MSDLLHKCNQIKNETYDICLSYILMIFSESKQMKVTIYVLNQIKV